MDILSGHHFETLGGLWSWRQTLDKVEDDLERYTKISSVVDELEFKEIDILFPHPGFKTKMVLVLCYSSFDFQMFIVKTTQK